VRGKGGEELGDGRNDARGARARSDPNSDWHPDEACKRNENDDACERREPTRKGLRDIGRIELPDHEAPDLPQRERRRGEEETSPEEIRNLSPPARRRRR